VVVFTDRGCVAVPLTVAASGGFIGRVRSLDLPLAGEKEDVGAHLLTFLRGSCNNYRRGELQRAGFRIRVEKASRGDLDALGVKYCGLEVHEETFIILREVAKGEAMDGELVLVGGGPKREPRGGADWERFIQTCRKSTEEGSVVGGRRRGGDPQKGNRTI